MSLDDYYSFLCPYCGADNTLDIDITGGSNQSFVTDCETCCAPIAVRAQIRNGEIVSVDIRRENE